MWSTIDHANTLTTNQTLQSHGTRRPNQIFVSGPVLEGTGFDTDLYSYDGAGNVSAMGDDAFTYDDLSRLDTALIHGYAQDFDYDPYGNLIEIVTTPPGGSDDTETIPVDEATNRLTGAAYAYDGLGNVTLSDGVTYVYDPMNLTKNRSGDGTQWAAIYTASDERLAAWDTAQGVVQETWTLRGLDGLVLREFFFGLSGGQLIFADGFESGDLCAWDTSTGAEAACSGSGIGDPTWSVRGTYVYRNGALLADVNGATVRHYHLDHLGSVRQITDDEGAVAEEHDYLPYGMEVSGNSAGLRFTGHERDGHLVAAGDELDYMHARYCSPELGRFLSVDPIGNSASRATQGWNKYSYVRGNPLRFRDPRGMYLCEGTEKQCSAFEAARKANLASKRKRLQRSASTYGSPGEDNGTTVAFGDPGGRAAAATRMGLRGRVDAAGNFQGMEIAARVTVRPGLQGNQLRAAVAHEGSHLLDGSAFAASFTNGGNAWNDAFNITGRETEMRAYSMTALVAAASNDRFPFDGGTFEMMMPETQIRAVTEGILSALYERDYLDRPIFDWPSMGTTP